MRGITELFLGLIVIAFLVGIPATMLTFALNELMPLVPAAVIGTLVGVLAFAMASSMTEPGVP